MTAALLCLPAATGCSSNNVVVEPVALAAVSPALMRAPALPKCTLPNRPELQPAEVRAYGDCYKAAFEATYQRLTGLQRAVRVREEATAKAVQAAKS